MARGRQPRPALQIKHVVGFFIGFAFQTLHEAERRRSISGRIRRADLHRRGSMTWRRQQAGRLWALSHPDE